MLVAESRTSASPYSPKFRTFYSVMRRYIKRIDSPYSYTVWLDKFLRFFGKRKIRGATVEMHWVAIAKYAPYKRYFKSRRPHWFIGSLTLRTHLRNNWKGEMDYKKLQAYIFNVLDLFVRSLPETY